MSKIKKIKKDTEIRWIDNNIKECPNSGIKNYAEFIKEEDGYIITNRKDKIPHKLVYVKAKKQNNFK